MTKTTLDLAAIVARALRISPPNFYKSILGDAASRDPKRCPPTELRIAQLDGLIKALPTAVQLLVPAIPWTPPVFGKLPGASTWFRQSRVFDHPASVPANADEAWLFINGICTDDAIVRLNAQYLSELVQRPITVIHNNTCGAVMDLLECALGKAWGQVTEAANVAIKPLLEALRNPKRKRVILLGHSQGTIITAVLLGVLQELLHPRPRAVQRELNLELRLGCAIAISLRAQAHRAGRPEPEITAAQLAKLEVYAIANCATEMRHIVPAQGKAAALPYIESIGNELDIVARLGMLAARGTRIDGQSFERKGAWGHLLNAHYLYPLEQEWRGAGNKPRSNLQALPGTTAAAPRLMAYFGGARPAQPRRSAPPTR